MARRRVAPPGHVPARRGARRAMGKAGMPGSAFKTGARAGRMPGCRAICGQTNRRRHSVLAAPAFFLPPQLHTGQNARAQPCFSPTQRGAVHHTALPAAEAFGHIQNALVFRAAEQKVQIGAAPAQTARPQECPAGPKALSVPACRPKAVQTYSRNSLPAHSRPPSSFLPAAPAPRPGRTARRPKTSPRGTAGLPSPWRTVLPQTYLRPHQTPSSRGCGTLRSDGSTPVHEDGNADARAIHNGIAHDTRDIYHLRHISAPGRALRGRALRPFSRRSTYPSCPQGNP